MIFLIYCHIFNLEFPHLAKFDCIAHGNFSLSVFNLRIDIIMKISSAFR